MRETLYNQRFGDIYFSPEDGLAETSHVFLAGNGLPERWRDRDRFTIVETGFGTGLNFLAAWALFEQTAESGQALDYVSFEMFPLARKEIREMLAKALSPRGEGLGEGDVTPQTSGFISPSPLPSPRGERGIPGFLEELLEKYPMRVTGFHRISLAGGRVNLTLIFDDVNTALPELEIPRGVDAWFLDGFAPAKNPQMWTETLFSGMARLSRDGASAASFTAAGAVRRGLAAAGFAVEKKPGFGRKREMTVARFQGGGRSEASQKRPRVAVIGGGLAGTSCAYVLRGQGAAVTLFEAAGNLAAGASGNGMGLYNPRFTAQRGAESGFYVAAFAGAVRTLEAIAQTQDIGFVKCGALHLVNSPEKEKRFRALCENWGWHPDHLRYLSAAQASEVAGISIDKDALFLPDAGHVSPQALCRAYAEGADVRLNAPVERIERKGDGWLAGNEEFDAVVFANAVAAKTFPALSWLPIHTVRGQISAARATPASEKLKCNICYGGYISAPYEGMHMIGSTFQKWLDDTDMKDEDHRENLDKLDAAVPALGGTWDITGGRAALRTAAQDHFPVIGSVPDAPGLYVSTAHGSHGIISSLAGAQLIADMIAENPYSLPRPSITALDGARFSVKEKKKENQR